MLQEEPSASTYLGAAVLMLVVLASLVVYGGLPHLLGSQAPRVLVLVRDAETLKGIRDAAADVGLRLVSVEPAYASELDWAIVQSQQDASRLARQGVQVVLLGGSGGDAGTATTVLEGGPSYSAGYMAALATSVRLPAHYRTA